MSIIYIVIKYTTGMPQLKIEVHIWTQKIVYMLQICM
jgi:hypothetical protein